MPEENLNRKFYLPRLTLEHYQGDAVVHWSLPVARRGRGWLTESFHAGFRELLLPHRCARRPFLPGLLPHA